MDGRKSMVKPNPREKANCISILLFWWTIEFFKKGRKKSLDKEDLYDPLPKDRSSVLGDRLEKQWRAELQNSEIVKRQPSLLKTIFRTFFCEICIMTCMQIINEFVFRLGTPMLLNLLLQYFKPESTTAYGDALIYAGGITITIAISSISCNQYSFMTNHVGGRMRIAICSVVYRKALRLSTTALGEVTPGKIVNLIANDVNRFEIVIGFLGFMWSAPLLTLTMGYLMYNQSGYAGFVGIAIVFLIGPIQAYTSKLISTYRMQTAIKTDERVRLMNEIISGVQVIKMYAWEKAFCALVQLARRSELKIILQSSYIRSMVLASQLFTSRMGLFATLLTMMLTGQKLSADKVFVFSSYFAVLAHTMGAMFVRGIAEITECLVAAKRLQNFLTVEEFGAGNVVMGPTTTSTGASSVKLKFNESYKRTSKNLSHIDEDGHNAGHGSTSKIKSVAMVASDMLRNEKVFYNVNSNTENRSRNKDSVLVTLDHVTAKWNLKSSETTLEDIDLEVEQGKLYVVIGMVGAGKSSLLSTILGELNLIEGNIRVNGEISYASQEACVFGSSIRQNILFGQDFDRQRYQCVVKTCDLVKDFDQFPQDDQTIVGERGCSLSGGQKARINLARAIYRQADIYLLDDPLSAVDSRVGNHLFKECLQRYLRGKTRILATHQLQFIKEADSIILMEQGRMHQYSDYLELINDHPQYNFVIAQEKETNVNIDSTESPLIRRQFSSTRSQRSECSRTDTDVGDNEDLAKLDILMEGTSDGKVKGNLLLRYFRVGSSIFMCAMLIFLFLATQFITSLNDYFISVLVHAEQSRSHHEELRSCEAPGNSSLIAIESSKILEQDKILPINYYIYFYTATVLFIFISSTIRTYFFARACLRSSQRLHDLIFRALIRTSMRFFDTNPSGRILNRFSKDLGTIDDFLPRSLFDASHLMLTGLGSVILCCIVNPIILVPALIISITFYWLRQIFVKISKNIRKLEGITRSPAFTHLNSTLDGISTIRAHKAQKILEKEFDRFQDIHTSSWYMFISCTMAFGLSLELCSFVFITLLTFSFLLLNHGFSGEQVGLALSQVITVTGPLQYSIRQTAEVTNHMMCVERLLEYANLAPEENLRESDFQTKRKNKRAKPDEKLTLVEPPKGWPSTGGIKFQNVYMRYSDEGVPALKNLTLCIRASEKVGIVGRTGAGKSSLISALFRLAKVEGVIEIDDIDTGKIALEDLRRHISIIPQDPVLFSGSLRRNLDPFNEFFDEQLWKVLEEVELKSAVMATGHGLDNRVVERGSNYSVGQRQLVCLARAILRDNRILVLDEATANVDLHTDAFIQRTIRTKFEACTVLTIAHRLNTIMDSDKVLVMDKGRLVAFDHPHVLLQNEYGPFTSLVKETGRAMYEKLCKVARDAYLTKNGDIQ